MMDSENRRARGFSMSREGGKDLHPRPAVPDRALPSAAGL